MRKANRGGLSRTELRALGTDRPVVEALARSGRLSDQQLQGLVASLLERGGLLDSGAEPGLTSHAPVARKVRDDLFRRPGGFTILPRAGRPRTLEETGTGPYWLVDSRPGYFKCTGWAETPPRRSIYLIDDEDTPYMFFGCRNPATGRGADAGLYTGHSLKAWNLFLFTNDETRPGRGWLDLPLERPWGSTTYLIFEVIPDGVKLTAIDPGTWQVIGTLTQTVPDDWGFGPYDRRLQVFREVSIAQSPENLGSGSWVEGLRWWGVHLYSRWGYSPWTRSQTLRTRKHPRSGTQVSVHIPLGRRYREESVSFSLLP